MSALVHALPLGAGSLTLGEREGTLDLVSSWSATRPHDSEEVRRPEVGEDEPGAPLGRYLLGPRLAVGGMGEVFVATQLGLGRFQKPLALKLLLPHLAADADAVEMFLDEANLAARMSHPNVVQIFDVGLTSGRYYIAMELVPGISMYDLIHGLAARGKRVSPAVLQYVARCLCDGLHHAHELRGPDGRHLGVVHRDVTPHNVLLSSRGEVKLSDFGIAKFRTCTSHTRPGMVKGKLAYLSPEQTLGKKPDRRADIFSAAVTLFYLSTLESPFRRDSQAATLKAVQDEPLPSLATLRPDLPASFAAALERATRKDPNERFATAHAFREALPSVPMETCDELAELVRKFSQGSHRAERPHRTCAILPGQRRRSRSRHPSKRWRRLRARVVLASVAVVVGLVLGVATARLAQGRARRAEAAPVTEIVRIEPVTTAQSESAHLPALESAQVAPLREARLPRRPSPLRGTGYITLDARPWAQVAIEGKPVGETPIYAYPVNAGTIAVTFRNPQSGKSETRMLTVVAGKLSNLQVDLR